MKIEIKEIYVNEEGCGMLHGVYKDGEFLALFKNREDAELWLDLIGD